MSRNELLEFSGISRSVLEARLRMLVKLLDALDPSLEPAERELVDQAVNEQLKRERI
jgi:hypothetical protein